MESAYGQSSQSWDKFSASAPMVGSAIDLLSPLIAQFGGGELLSMLNMLRFNRQDIPFYNMDRGLYMDMRRHFNTLTAPPADTTNIQLIGRSLASYFMDDRAMAEQALRSVSMLGGGTYALGTGGRNIAEITGGWNVATMGRYNDALVNMMADTWNLPFDPNVTKGQRQMLLAGMIKSDPTLLQQYGEARRLADQAGVNWSNDWSELRGRIAAAGPENETLQRLTKLTETLEKAEKSLTNFGEAASIWGKILKTDSVEAKAKINNLLGGTMEGTFAGDEIAAAMMGYGVRHVGGVTGRGTDSVMAMVNQAGKLIQQMGGPADAAVNVATTAMLQSFGLEGYRVLQEEADKATLQFNAELMQSDAASIYFGGFQKYAEQQLNGSDTTLSLQQVERDYHRLLMENGGLTLESVNKLTGGNYSLGDMIQSSRMSFAGDARLMPNNFMQMAMGGAQNEIMEKILQRSGLKNEDGTAMTLADLERLGEDVGVNMFGLMRMNPTQFNRALSGIEDERTRERIMRVRYGIEDTFNTIRSSDPRALGAFGNYDFQVVMGLMDPEQRRRYETLNRQVALRSELSRTISGGDMFKSMADAFRTNPDLTFGDILAAAGSGDLSGEQMEAIQSLSLTAEDSQKLARNMDTLAKQRNTDEDKLYLRHNFDMFNRAVRHGMSTKEAARKYLSGIGVSVDDEGKLQVGEMYEINENDWIAGRGEYMEVAGKTAESRKRVMETLVGKAMTNMTIADKAGMVDYIAMLEVATENIDFEKNADKRSAMEAFIKAAESGGEKDIRKAFLDLQKFSDEDFQGKRADVMKQMGLTSDQSELGMILSGVLKSLFETFLKTFADQGAGVLKVRES